MKLVAGEDARVAAWMFEIAGAQPIHFNLAVGAADDAGELVAGVLFTGWNGSDVEVHYYGPGTLKRPTVRLIFSLALRIFNVNRVTVRTRKAHMARGVRKLGAVYEGRLARFYGPTDGDQHAAQQFAFFREQIIKLSGEPAHVWQRP